MVRSVYAFYIRGRRTPAVGISQKDALSRVRRPKNPVVVAREKLKGTDLRNARAGKWVKGNRNRSKNVRGYGPAPKGNSRPRRRG